MARQHDETLSPAASPTASQPLRNSRCLHPRSGSTTTGPLNRRHLLRLLIPRTRTLLRQSGNPPGTSAPWDQTNSTDGPATPWYRTRLLLQQAPGAGSPPLSHQTDRVSRLQTTATCHSATVCHDVLGPRHCDTHIRTLLTRTSSTRTRSRASRRTPAALSSLLRHMGRPRREAPRPRHATRMNAATLSSSTPCMPHHHGTTTRSFLATTSRSGHWRRANLLQPVVSPDHGSAIGPPLR